MPHQRVLFSSDRHFHVADRYTENELGCNEQILQEAFARAVVKVVSTVHATAEAKVGKVMLCSRGDDICVAMPTLKMTPFVP